MKPTGYQDKVEYDDGGITHHHGRDDHVAYLVKPLHEAHAAVHERAHRLGFRL